MRLRSFIPNFPWILSLLLALAASPSAFATSTTFTKDIRPLLETHCYKCHGAEKTKGDVNLSTFTDDSAIERDPKLWQTVLQQLRDRNMPPASKPQPPEPDRQRLADAIAYSLSHLDFAKIPKDPGRVTIRRLNRAEYNNTLRDLLGVETHPADLFPADGGGGGGFDNNADTLFVPPLLMEQYLKAAGEVLRQADRSRWLTVKPDEGKLSNRDAGRKCVEGFASRAFRRPATATEIDRLMKLFDAADTRGDSFESAVRLALKGTLVSPQFLFRLEQDRPTAEPYPVSDYELASRLSYFIWASTPDDELLKVASEGKLHDDANLEQQAQRMLNDPKSKALAENFGGQWLGFRDVRTTAQPDRKRFPEFTPAVRDAMYDEAVAFVDSVFRDDAPLTTLLDADYTFVNEALARHYGLPKVKGEEIRRVSLPDRNRGGVLGLGAVLTTTSYPLRTSPVLRGRWVLDAVLGAPPPPPPADVPELPKDDAAKDGLSFRKMLEQHRQRAECAACHSRMDPIGFGLENFDPIGRWRTTQAGQPVDSAGELTTGETFAGPAELKKVLLARKDDFARNVTERLLAYALGRGLEYYDQPTVKQVTDAVAKDEYRSSRLVVEIVKSYPFRYRRGE